MFATDAIFAVRRDVGCGGAREDDMDVVPHSPHLVVPSASDRFVACSQAVLYPSGAPKGRLLPNCLGSRIVTEGATEMAAAKKPAAKTAAKKPAASAKAKGPAKKGKK